MSWLWSIDGTIILGFLLLTLFVGLGQGQKNKNIKDYALGGRNFSTGALVATLVATWLGGGTFTASLAKTYSDGLFYVFASMGQVVSFLIIAFLFVPKMQTFLGKISVAEAMEEYYGANVRIIVAATGIMASVGSIAVQFKVFGNVVSYFLDMTPFTGIIISALIVTIYSAFGGIRAVTFTDVFQMLTFGVAIPIIGVMIWNHVHFEGISVANALQEPKFNISEFLFIDTTETYSMIFLMLYFAMPGLEPTVFQRISMGKNIEQARSALLITALLILLIPLAVQWVSFLIFSINPHLDSKDLFGHIIENYTHIGLKGLMVAGVFALAMSTADSQINASSVLFSHDICSNLNFKINELAISKVFALAVGVFGIYMATSSKDLLDIVLTTRAFYMPIVTIPIMLTILGFRTTTFSVLSGMFGGFIVILAWKLANIKADGIFVAMIANLICLLGAHYLFKQPGGWIKKKKVNLITKPRGPSLIQRIKGFDYIEYCKKKSPSNELSYIGFGAYIIIFTVTTMYAIDLKDNAEYRPLFLALYQIMMVTGVAFCTYPIWPHFVQKEKFSKILWPIPIIVIMICFNAIFVTVNTPNALQFVMFTVNLLISVILLGWKFGISCLILGTTSTYYVCKYLGLVHELNPNATSPASIIIYIMVVVGAIIMLFIKPQEDTIANQETQIDDFTDKIYDQEKEIDRLGATGQRILNNVNHELRLPVGNVLNFAEMLGSGLEAYDKDERKELVDEVLQNSRRLSSMILNMLDLMTIDSKKMDLDKKIVNLGELVEDRIASCKNMYLKDKKLNLEAKLENNLLISVDPNYMRQVVDNLILNSITHSEKGTIRIHLRQNEDKVILTISDEGKGIASGDIYDIFTPFKIGKNTESQAEGRGIGLALCRAVVESHQGKIEAYSDGKQGARFRITLPYRKLTNV